MCGTFNRQYIELDICFQYCVPESGILPQSNIFPLVLVVLGSGIFIMKVTQLIGQ